MRVPSAITRSALQAMLFPDAPAQSPREIRAVDNALSMLADVQANHDKLTSRILQEARRDADRDAGTLRLIAILLGLAGIALGLVLGMVTAGMVAS